MLDAPIPRLVAQAAPPPPVGRLVLGRPVAEACALVPRIFSLCREAQGAAMRAALGLGADAGDLRREMLRDHLLKLFVTLPEALGQGARPLPADWEAAGPALARAVFGPAGRAPASADGLAAWLDAGTGVAPVLRALRDTFLPAEAAAEGLRPPEGAEALGPGPFENSVAGRRMGDPAMRAAEARWGRGPLWRVLARAIDLGALLEGPAPAVARHRDGLVTVWAARGTYALRARAEHGRVVRFERRTPTDHLLAPDGLLDRSLGALPADRAALGPLVLEVLDPCTPVRLRLAHA